MSKIRIKNFGPIKEGYVGENNSPWMEIEKVTVFIGNQGSGKSCVAKLISTFSWLEKALRKGQLREKDVEFPNRFMNRYCGYHNMQNYFRTNTEISYNGEAFSFSYFEGNFSVIRNKPEYYKIPKIMYVPAERNFVSAVDKPEKLKYLPKSLATFLDEFVNAQENVNGGVELPINNTSFEYDKLNKIAHIRGNKDDYRIRLSQSSSGFQSAVPLFIVTRNLALSINERDESDSSTSELSVEEENRLRIEIRKIYKNDKLSASLKKVAIEELSAKYTIDCFINIVEEPEQNLFPTSQHQILNSLLEFNNINEGSKLIMTTHSPYLINFLSIAIQGEFLLDKIINGNSNKVAMDKYRLGKNEKTFKERLNDIVPIKSLVNYKQVVIYELDEKNGTIKTLPSSYGIPSDKNYLNQSLRHGNEMFDGLLEIEQEL